MKKGYKLSQETCAARAENMRRFWANMPAEERARRSAICSERTTRQMADPEARARSAAIFKKSVLDAGKHIRTLTPEERQQISDRQKGKPLPYMNDPEKAARCVEKKVTSIRAYCARMGKNLPMLQPEAAAKAAVSRAEDRKTNPRNGKFETNTSACDWHLRDPLGHEYHFRNLLHFIRTHTHLFTAYQLAFLTGHEGQEKYTRAAANLHKLNPRNAHPATSAFGWTWVRWAGEPDPRCEVPRASV